MPRTMNITTRSLALALLSLAACGPEGFSYGGYAADTGGPECSGPRIDIAEVDCDANCHGRWECTGEWSHVLPIEEVAAMPTVDASTIWPCSPDPDIDVCVMVDAVGHLGCFRMHGAWAVAVAPACAVGSFPGWLDVGSGMMAFVG